jgi:transcriptional regulator of aromatic amino acid metabolism
MPKRIELDTGELVQMYARGVSSIEASRRLGVAHKVVLSRLREAEIDIRPVRLELNIPEMVRLYEHGMSSREVGRRMEVSHDTVISRLREAGVPIRPPHRPVQHHAPYPFGTH